MTDTTPVTRADDPVQYPAAGQPASRLVLHANRHCTVVLDDGTLVPLRPPSVAEWRTIRHAYASAAAAIAAVPEAQRADLLYGYDPADDRPTTATAGDDAAGDGAQPTSDDGGQAEQAVYAVAFSRVVETVGTTRVDADRLPMWATSGSLYATLYEHWRRVDVVMAQPADDVDVADVPPGGSGPVADTAAPQQPPPPAALQTNGGVDGTSGVAVPVDASQFPTFDLDEARAQHAAAGTLSHAAIPPPVAAGGIQTS